MRVEVVGGWWCCFVVVFCLVRGRCQVQGSCSIFSVMGQLSLLVIVLGVLGF